MHDEEVTWESHRFHNVQLKLHTLRHVVGNGVAIEFAGTVIGELCKVVCLKLYAIELVDATQALYLQVGFVFR